MPHKNPIARKAYQDAYNARNAEKKKRQAAEWCQIHRSEYIAYHKSYRAKNATKIKARRAAYHKANKLNRSSKNRLWRQRNRSRIKESRKLNLIKVHGDPVLKEKYRRRARAYYEAHQGEMCAKARAYAKQNPHVAAASRIRRQRRISTTITRPDLIGQFMTRVRNATVVRCYYCNLPMAGSEIHFDHIIPLSKGGAHCVTNICASCPSCNLEKSAKLIGDWQPKNQQVLTL